MKNAPEYLARLRQATSDAHKRLEMTTGGDKLLSNPTKEHYARLLTTHLNHHLTIAEHVGAAFDDKDQVLDWPNCERIEALKKDLSILNIPFPDIPEVGSKGTPAYVIGLIYVSEGSCMGNQMMLKALSKHEEYNSWGANHFFLTCKEGFSTRWKSFMQLMHPYGQQDYNSLEAGSLRGFQLFEEIWLNKQDSIKAY